MTQLRWTIDGRHFTSLEEYEAALRDKNLIQKIVGNLSIGKPEDIEVIYLKLQNNKYQFETIVGRQFDDNIYELYSQIKRERREKEEQRRERRQKKKIVSFETFKQKKEEKKNTQNKKVIHIDEYSEDMRQEIAKVMRKKRIMRWLIAVACLLIALTCFAYVTVYSKAADISRQQFEELAKLKEQSRATYQKTDTGPREVKIHLTPKGEVVIPDILPEYQMLVDKNQDMIGWIKIDDTVIDYPVVQTTNNDFYLEHDFNKSPDKNGCIFLDQDCDVLADVDNLILYGHHMRSGNMFGNLNKYKSADYWKSHPYIQFDTIYEKGKYEVMYAFQTKVYAEDAITFKYYQFINATSQKEFASAMTEMSKLSLYNTGVSASYGDKLLTLSTCDYQESKGRFVVVAKKCD